MQKNMITFLFGFMTINLFAQPASKVSQSCNNFAFAGYKQLVKQNQDKNFVYSPLSLNIALRMAAGGARENTLEQICRVVGGDEDPVFIHSNIRELAKTMVADLENIDLEIANGIWLQDKYPIKKEFLELMQNLYEAPCATVDFVSAQNRVKAKTEINKWISDKTKGNIQNLINDNVLTANTVMVLANAIYFKGSWSKPFNANLSYTANFQSITGKTQPVKFMKQQDQCMYAETRTLQLIELPYKNDLFGLIIVLPDKNLFNQTQDSLSADVLDSLIDEAKPTRVDISIPAFKMEFSADFSQMLREAGIVDAFGDKADFSGINDKKELYISKIIHRATVIVDEKGSEAAAATAVVMDRKMSLADQVKFEANHPFMYFIRDKRTGAILFAGRFVSVP